MKILFTGSSSFTGYWFIKELVQQGHEVTATVQRQPGNYNGVRAERIDLLTHICRTIFDCPLGSDTLYSLADEGYDIYCHHAADVTDYKSPNFDVIKAVNNNTIGLRTLLPRLKNSGCSRIALTGSVFEQREGLGMETDRAFSPYGLSKGLTSDLFRFYSREYQMHLGKFVIPNPFGPYEEKRFTSYLIRNWMEKRMATVSTPDYVRDNIHVSLLAKAYAKFVTTLPSSDGFSTAHPSGYVETQGEFTKRFAEAMQPRLELPCKYHLEVQRDFPEPKIRYNSGRLDPNLLDWKENQAWNDLANFYQKTYH